MDAHLQSRNKSFFCPGHGTAYRGVTQHSTKTLSLGAPWANIFSRHSIITRFSIQRRIWEERLDFYRYLMSTRSRKKTSRFHGSNGWHVELVSFPMCCTRPRFGLGLHVSRFMHLHVLFLFCIRRCKGKIRYHEAKGVQPPCSITLFSYVQILFSLLFVKAWLYPRLVGSLGGTLALPARRAGGYGSQMAFVFFVHRVRKCSAYARISHALLGILCRNTMFANRNGTAQQ